MGHISQDALKNIKIPLPPLEFQDKIAEEVKTRVRRAWQFKEEAKVTLEKAKARVERMILGEEEIQG